MITETTRDKALIAAANGKISMVIYQKNGHPEYANLTQILGDVLAGKNNIYVADIVEPLKEKPANSDEPKLEKVKDKPEFVKASKRGRQVNLDDGKIMALHNAGWSEEKIAVEMDVTQSTIHYHLAKMKEAEKT